MTSFLHKSFSVVMSGDKFTENWERTFGERPREVHPCRCANSRVGYRRNGRPICAKCGSEMGERPQGA